MKDDGAQLQVIEAITVAVILFSAIAMSSIFRLPTSPATFQDAELERLATDTLRVMKNKVPDPDDDCNEAGFDCPFATTSEMDRLLSLALGYVGPNMNAADDALDREPLKGFLNQALPDGVRYSMHYSNSVNATKIAPLGRNPPTFNVVVGHQLVAPKWTVYSDFLAESVLIRIGESTGFDGVNEIRDPLNRDHHEFQDPGLGESYLDDFVDRVPIHSVLGTFAACIEDPFAAPPCDPLATRYFTVTPPSVFGAGSPVLPGDRDNSTNIVSLGSFRAQVMRLAGGYDLADELYLDLDPDGKLSVGDMRVTEVESCRPVTNDPCRMGSTVASLDQDLSSCTATLMCGFVGYPALQGPEVAPFFSFRDLNTNFEHDPSEPVYITSTQNVAVTSAVRLTRVGLFHAGTLISAGDPDENDVLTALEGDLTLWYDERGGTPGVDPGEAVYIDMDEVAGHLPGVDEGDIHLTALGTATERYYYDLRLVVWFGI